MGIHDGHRKRLKARFLSQGLDGFDDHTVLELLLFYGVPQRDVNPLAHALLSHFGSLAAVLDAPAEELLKVPGVGESVATLLKLAPQLGRRYMISRVGAGEALVTAAQMGAYLVPRFFGERDEVVYIVCLDAKCKVLGCQLLFRGGINSAFVSVRKIVETALIYNAAGVILAHNHTSGIAVPSQEDCQTTAAVKRALCAVGVELVDHIVVADDDFVSMAQSHAL